MNELKPRTRKRLDEILRKGKESAGGKLEDHEIAFLRALRFYLTKKQLKEYKKFLTPSKAEAKRKAIKEKLDTESKEIDADEMNRTAHPAEKKEQIPYKELQVKAKKLKLPYVGISRVNLEKAILETKPLKEAGKDGKEKEK